jgi:PPOX class probable F420-dependent enzyme
MSEAEVRAFVEASPARPGTLATVRADGSPHVAPVWIAWAENGTLVFTTGASTVKGRNLRRQGRAALCVEDQVRPYSFVVFEGPVEISEDPVELRRWAGRIGGRYMGADRAEEFGTRNGVPGELLVRLRPDRVLAQADVAD